MDCRFHHCSHTTAEHRCIRPAGRLSQHYTRVALVVCTIDRIPGPWRRRWLRRRPWLHRRRASKPPTKSPRPDTGSREHMTCTGGIPLRFWPKIQHLLLAKLDGSHFSVRHRVGARDNPIDTKGKELGFFWLGIVFLYCRPERTARLLFSIYVRKRHGNFHHFLVRSINFVLAFVVELSGPFR